MEPRAIAIVILALAAVLAVILLVANGSRRRRHAEHVPPAMRPGYSDEQLERTVLERSMQWGLVLTVGLALFFPLYWLNESRRLNRGSEDFFVEAVVRGEQEYEANCVRCHSAGLVGGAAPSPYDPDSAWPAPALNNIAARYAESRNVTDIRDFIVQTLHRGRPGTPMPTWGAAYGGPMTDQQIEDITAYILANQISEVSQVTEVADASGEELYQGNCAKCHGTELNNGFVGPSLVGVTERHSRADILGILRNGIYVPTGAVMPGFGEVLYQYPDARYDDETLEQIIDYLEDAQPDAIPDEALNYQTPGIGGPNAAASESEGAEDTTT